MHVDSVTSVGAVLVGSDKVSVSVAMSCCCGGGDVCEADDEREQTELCRPVSLEPWTSAGELRAHRDLGVAWRSCLVLVLALCLRTLVVMG